VQKNKRRLETLHLDVLIVLLVSHRLHTTTTRQLIQRLGHHHDTSRVVRALEQTEDILGLEHRLWVDAHVRVKFIWASLEALGARLLLAHHNLMTTLGTLHDEVRPSHQKVGIELGSGKNETQLHRDTARHFSMLTRTGYVIPPNPELKRELTVRAIENALGLRPPPFKVFKETTKHLCVPRFFGEEKLGPARDTRPEPVAVSIPFTGSLRGIQTEAIDTYKGQGVLSLDVGFGKTVCALAIAARMGVRTMIIVHKEFLANQWAERIEQFCPGCTIGRVQQDRCELDHPFVIGMIQTLCMRGHAVGTFDSIGLVIVDEAHHVGAPAFSQAMFTMCPKYTLGLTATPDRKDGLTRVLYWFLGNCFYAAHRQSSKNVRVKRVPFIHPEFLKAPPVSRIGKVCLATMVNTLVELPERNELLLDIAREAATDHQVLILSDRRAHCEWLVRELGDSAGLYMGGMKQEQLDASAKKRIVVGTFSLAHEGLDIATLSAIVLATPHSDVRQAVGRILRTDGPKVIYDMADTWSVMNAMFRKRAKIYTDCGFQMDQAPREEEPETASIFKQGKCLL